VAALGITIAWRYELARTVDVMDVQHTQTMFQHTCYDRDHRSRIASPFPSIFYIL